MDAGRQEDEEDTGSIAVHWLSESGTNEYSDIIKMLIAGSFNCYINTVR